jgi:hypothetical protein
MMGSSFGSGNMMNKMSSKFTQLQKGVTGPPSAANPNGKPADWKKWGKRAAIGVAGIGALALGVDAAGDMFSGAEGMMSGGGDFTGGADLSGGGDFMGGDFSGGGDAAAVADAQTAVDANAMEHAMAGIGEQNSSMLLDPAGATCMFFISMVLWNSLLMWVCRCGDHCGDVVGGFRVWAGLDMWQGGDTRNVGHGDSGHFVVSAWNTVIS